MTSLPRPSAFADAPFLAFWEVTRACDLACKHCRADAQPCADPRELTPAESRALLDDLASLGTRVVVLTGGDPAKRPDLVELVAHGHALGIRMCLTPSATPLVTDELLVHLRDAGLARIALSLDGVRHSTHDAFRGVDGSYERTLAILRRARALGMSTQINTSVSKLNRHELEPMAALAGELGVTLWSVFFVVPTGRAAASICLSAVETEEVLQWLATVAANAPFDVKTTAAPAFRRVLLQRKTPKREIVGIADGVGRSQRGLHDGAGVMFVSHTGDVYPSGFLPRSTGNVRETPASTLYREHELFVALRDADRLGGKCGRCEFRYVCGGSRAHAYAVTGDPLATDPTCVYQPGRV